MIKAVHLKIALYMVHVVHRMLDVKELDQYVVKCVLCRLHGSKMIQMYN